MTTCPEHVCHISVVASLSDIRNIYRRLGRDFDDHALALCRGPSRSSQYSFTSGSGFAPNRTAPT
jgi:hypothetical protein